MHKVLKSLAVLAMLVTGANAGAGVITDYVNLHALNGNYVLLSAGQSFTITHDLTDSGVPDQFLVDSASLRIGLADDRNGNWLSEIFEVAFVIGEGVAGLFEVGGNIFSYDYRTLPVYQAGIDSLNSIGALEITVTSLLGDFYWKNSELTAWVSPVSVPEPKTLALLAIGIVGLALVRRRKLA